MSREIALVTKDPDGVEPQGFDWTERLGRFATTELVIDSEWVITGPDGELTMEDASIVSGNLQTQGVLTGGTLGADYTVTNRITTTSGYPLDQSFPVHIEQK